MTSQWFLACIMVMTFINAMAFEKPNMDKKYFERQLSNVGISSESASKIVDGDKTVFKSMDTREFEKLTPNLIAHAGKEAIGSLNPDQIRVMTKNLYQGDEGHLGKILGVMSKTQIGEVLDSIEVMNKNSSERKHLNCVQFEPMIKALKRTSGEPKEWNKDVFTKLGSDFVQCLPLGDLKNAAGNKDVYRTLLRNVRNKGNKHKRVSRVEKMSLLEGATIAFGAMKDWKLDDLKSASSLVTMLKPKYLKKLPTTVVKGAIEMLGQQDWEEKRGKELVAKLKDASEGFGAITTWSADTLERLGNLRGSLSRKELNEISSEALRKSVRAFGRTPLPQYKKRVLTKRLKVLYGKPKNWTTGHIQNASDLLGGLEINELEEIDDDALFHALPSMKDIKFPRHKGRVLARKLQKKIGNVQQWNSSVVKKMGSLMKDLPETMLRMLKPDEAREAVKMLRGKMNIPIAKKRVLIKQALMKGGNSSRLRIKEFGEFVSEFPLSELKKIQRVADLLPDELSGNDSTQSEPMWNPSQARTLLEGLVMSETNWGPVSMLNENWTLGNIKKLGRLGLGLRKSDLANLSNSAFPDFAAEFSRVVNWTNGQVKRICNRFINYFKDRESEITVTEIASLGDFLINVMDPDIKKLSHETAREAIRLMGASHLYQRLPKVLKQRKTKTAMELLKKDVASLTGDELEDLGVLINGFEKKDINEISSNAFVDAAVSLGDVEDLDKEISEALASKAVEAYGGTSEFDGEILHDLGKIVEGLDSNAIAGISDTIIDENLHIFAEATLDADVAKAVMDKSESSRRKRRAIDTSSTTGDELIEMGSTLLALTKDQVLNVTNDAFISSVAEISKIKGFTSEQLAAWASKAKSAWGSTNLFTEDQLLQLNEFATGFTGDELKQMSFASNEVIENFGQVTGYSQAQIDKLWENIKTGKSMANFTGDDLKSLGVISLGVTEAELGQISTEAYQNAALELGQIEGWSYVQLKSLKNKAVAAFGAVTSWTSAQMSLAGAAIGGCTAAEIQSINADQLDAVKPSALKQIPAAIFKEFSVAQLSELSPEQAVAIHAEQRAALSSEQLETLLKVEDDTLHHTSGCYTNLWSYRVLVSIITIQLSRWL